MKYIYSKFNDFKKKNKKILKRYWSLLYPEEYVRIMVAKKEQLIKHAFKSDKKNIKFYGVLRQTEDGFVYLKVSDLVAHALINMIDDKHIKLPPYFNEEDSIGAHVSLISSSEMEGKKIEPELLGKKIYFDIGDAYKVKPEGWEEMAFVWFLQVSSPEFYKIRHSLGLSKTYKNLGHDFHITFAVQEA